MATEILRAWFADPLEGWDGEQPPQATKDEAELRAAKIRAGYERWARDVAPLILAAYLSRDWVALDYASWEDYVHHEWGTHRLKLPRADRRDVAQYFRLAGMSTRAIAQAVNADRNTIAGDVAEIQPPDRVLGADGKQYPAHVAPPAACVLCGHACAHEEPCGLIDGPDGPQCANEEACAQRVAADPANQVTPDGGYGAPSDASRAAPPAACEACGEELEVEKALAGYKRCGACDPEGDHYAADFGDFRTGPHTGPCVVCEPPDGSAPVVSGDGSAAGLSTALSPAVDSPVVPEREREWPEQPPAAGVVDSATPGNPTEEAPAPPAADVEYAPWREAYRRGLDQVREDLYLITLDMSDPATIAERCDEPGLQALEELARQLTAFCAQVRELRAPLVWVATIRKGIEYHRPSDRLEGPKAQPHGMTVCGRSMRTGQSLRASTPWLVEHAKPCPRCWPEGGEAA